MFTTHTTTTPAADAAKTGKTAKDLEGITGLKEVYARECFDRFGAFGPALASFAQSSAKIPADYFVDRRAFGEKRDEINETLRALYQRAREIKKEKTCSDVEALQLSEAKPTGDNVKPPENSPSPAAAGASGTGTDPADSKPSASPSVDEKPTPAVAESTSKPATETGPTISNSIFNFGSAAFASKPTLGAPVTAFTIGFGSDPIMASGSAPQSAAPAGFGSGFLTQSAPVAAPPPKKEIRYCDPEHFTGPLLEMPLFWEMEVEARCPLLNLNKGFLEANRDSLRPRLEKWVKKSSFYRKAVQYVVMEDDDEEVARVIIKDADRTFFHPDHRKKFVAFLHAMYHEFDAYGQAMSYLAGLCLLVLDEEETASVLRFVSKTYIPRHWAAEAVGFSTSAWVVEHFMRNSFPDVAEHLSKLNFWPDTYLQKILTGLCVHVLNFQELFVFLDLFMEHGFAYLIQFSLSIVERFRSNLLQVKSSTEANVVYEIMRLDSHFADPSDVKEILHRSASFDLGEEASSIDIIRTQVFDAKVAPRLQRAPKTEAFEPCEQCETKRPMWWSDNLGAVCNDCKEAHPEEEYSKY